MPRFNLCGWIALCREAGLTSRFDYVELDEADHEFGEEVSVGNDA